MNYKIRQQIVKSINSRSITEAELEVLDKLPLHELMFTILECGYKGAEVLSTVQYIYNASEHYKQSGGSIHHEKGTIDL